MSSVASRCIVLRIAQVRTIERSSIRARSTAAARNRALRARKPRRPALRSWAWMPAVSRATSAGSPAVARTVEELRGGAQHREARRVDGAAQSSSSWR